MRRSLTRYGVLAAVVAAGVAGAGCSKTDNARTDSASAPGTVGAATDTAAARMARGTDTLAAGSTHAGSNGWTDAQILAFAAAVSTGEMREGQLAARKGTNAAVKAFGRQMVTDHQALITQGKTYATKHKLTPDTTKSDVTDVMKDGRDAIKDFTDKKAGADWDKAYIDKEIDDHKHVLDKLQDAAKSTTDPEMRAMLEKATGKIQEHLTKAQDIKEKKLTS